MLRWVVILVAGMALILTPFSGSPQAQQTKVTLQFASIERFTGAGWESLPSSAIVSVGDSVRLRLRGVASDGRPLANMKILSGVEDPVAMQSVTDRDSRIAPTDADGYLRYPADTALGRGLTIELPVEYVFRFFTPDGGAFDVCLAADNHGFPSALSPADYSALNNEFAGILSSAGPGTTGFLPVLPPIIPTEKVRDSELCMAAGMLSLQYRGTRDLYLEQQLKAYSDLCPKALPVLISEHAVERVQRNLIIYAPSATACGAGLLVPGLQPAAAVGCPILVAQAQKDAIFSVADAVTDVWNPELNLPFAKDTKQVVSDAELLYDLRSLVRNAHGLAVDVSYLRSQGPFNPASLLQKHPDISYAAFTDASRILAKGSLQCVQSLSNGKPMGCLVPNSYVEVLGQVDVDEGKALNVSAIRIPWSSSAWKPYGGEDSVPAGLVFAIPPSAVQWLRRTNAEEGDSRRIGMGWGVGDPRRVSSFAYLLDQSPETDPASAPGAKLTGDTQVTVSAPKDGIWYFHLASRDAGTQEWLHPRHYRVEVGQTGLLDVAICIDRSGSMMDDIKMVQAECDATLEALDNFAKDQNISLQVGLITYTRHDEPDWIHADRLTSDVSTIRSYLRAIDITNPAIGKGGNEDTYGAVMYAMDQTVGGQRIDKGLGWRPGAAKIVIPIGDEPQDDPDWQDRTLAKVVKVALDLDPVHFYPLVLPKERGSFLSPALAAKERLAKATGGQLIKVGSARELPQAVVSAVKLAVRQHRNEVWRKSHPPYLLYGGLAAVLGIGLLAMIVWIIRAAAAARAPQR